MTNIKKFDETLQPTKNNINFPIEKELHHSEYNKALVEINKVLLKDNQGNYNWFIPKEVADLLIKK